MLTGLRGFPQCLSGQSGAEEHAGHVHRDQFVPFGQADLLDPLADEHAGVVDQNVELAKPAGGEVDGGGPVSSFVTSRCTYSAWPPADVMAATVCASPLIQYVADDHIGAGLAPSVGRSLPQCRARRPRSGRPCHQDGSCRSLPMSLRGGVADEAISINRRQVASLAAPRRNGRF